MKVLVTGATGFIGRYVIDELLRKGCNIVIASRSKNYPEAWRDNPLITFRDFNLQLVDNKKDYFSYFGKPDTAIHLAWSGLPNYTQLFHIEQNLPQQYLFLKNLVANGLPAITIAGTCFEYGMQQGSLDEAMAVAPGNSYALAKYTLYCFLIELKKHFPFKLNWMRLFYMYGKGQAVNSLFSQLDVAITKGDAFFNMSGGEQERDFLPVETVAGNICNVALLQKELGLVNCSSGTPVKVKEFVSKYIAENNSSIKLNLGYYPYATYEPMSFWGNNDKLVSFIGPF